MNPDEKLYDGIDRGIRFWDNVLLCASKGSLNSWWVDNEISIALSKERRLLQETQKEVLTIIPMNLDGYMFQDEWKKGIANNYSIVLRLTSETGKPTEMNLNDNLNES